MNEKTKIAWTDHTFNPWWGCTKISPGCDNCYAEKLANRFQRGHWGQDAPRRVMGENHWRGPVMWNKRAADNGLPVKVFCGSMCDVFDNQAPSGQRERLWEIIRTTPFLDWQLLTKRPINILKYLPSDWGAGYENVWLGVSVENQEQWHRRVEILKEIPARVRFISCEPLLEGLGRLDLEGIDWVIIGGESGLAARRMEPVWPVRIINQCYVQSVPVFFKQWGGTGKEKGGCQIDGHELKEWPQSNDRAGDITLPGGARKFFGSIT